MEKFQFSKSKAAHSRKPGLLKRCDSNPRYFADYTGKPVYLTGSHTWSNMQEYLGPNPEKLFDYEAYLLWMEKYGFNFMRGWVWEEASYDNISKEKIHIGPLPFLRTGPGTAMDGELKFDLNCLNQEYFDRIRKRVIDAGRHGIYVSIMLFNRWSINENSNTGILAWNGHPFNKNNNINDVDGDPLGLGGRAVHTLELPEVLRYQEEYIKKIIDTVNDLENVLFEIGNEHFEDSWQWQYSWLNFIKEYEAQKPLQHPVGMTSGGGGSDAVGNKKLFDSAADWISPRNEKGMSYTDDPIAADGAKVIISDTDHLWGLGGHADWVWKSFLRGLNPILMDPYEPIYKLEDYGLETWDSVNNRNHPIWEPIRKSMALTAIYANRVNLALTIPRADLASSGYCLADYGREYLVYVPGGTEVMVNLGDTAGKFFLEWMNPHTGKQVSNSFVAVKSEMGFANPFDEAAVLYITSIDGV